MSHSLTTNPNSRSSSGTESSSGVAVGSSGSQQHPPIYSQNNSSKLVTASGNLVLENEQILKLFPKCRPRSQNESMNQFYASIKEQYQPPQPTGSLAAPLSASTKSYNSNTIKNIISDPQIMSANSKNLNSNSPASSSHAQSSEYIMYAPTNKKGKVSTTNPFLNDSQKEEHYHPTVGLTHSQSDCGVCFAGQQTTKSGPFATSASSSQLASTISPEMMTNHFQRHIKDPLSYQSNPFIASHKLDEYEEEQLNIIVQDEQTATPEYYFDRRTVWPATHVQQHQGYNQHARSTPVGNLLHSPELKEYSGSSSSSKWDHKGYPRDNHHYHKQQHEVQNHYLNVGRSPVNSLKGRDELANNIDADELTTSKHNKKQELQEKTNESTKSSSHLASKKRNKSVAVVSDGEVVIFDDVEDSWYNLKVKPESIGEGHVYKQNFIAEPESISPERNKTAGDSPHELMAAPPPPSATEAPAAGVGSNVSNVAGMMIEYSESPRRFGSGRGGQTPLPGFPHRVVSPGSPPTMSSIRSTTSHHYGGETFTESPPPSAETRLSSSKISGVATTTIIEEETEYEETSDVPVANNQNNTLEALGLGDSDADEYPAGINVVENAYKDTGLSVRDDKYSVPTSTFDYLYEFSETRKVLEEFFKCPTFELDDEKFPDKLSESECDSIDIQYDFREPTDNTPVQCSIENLDSGSPTGHLINNYEEEQEARDTEEVANEADVEDEVANDNTKQIHRRRTFDLSISSLGRQSPEIVISSHNNNENGENKNGHHQSGKQCYRYSPETTDYDSNCGDLDSLSGDFNTPQSIVNYQTYMRQCYASMPVLEDGLSSGHTSDAENNNAKTRTRNNGMRNSSSNIIPAVPTIKESLPPFQQSPTSILPVHIIGNGGSEAVDAINVNPNDRHLVQQRQHKQHQGLDTDNYYLKSSNIQPNTGMASGLTSGGLAAAGGGISFSGKLASTGSVYESDENLNPVDGLKRNLNINSKIFKNTDPGLESLYSINKFQSNVPISDIIQMTPPPPPAPVPYRKPANNSVLGCENTPIFVPTSTGPSAPTTEIHTALKDIRSTIHRTKSIQQDLVNPRSDHIDSHSNDDALNAKSSAVWSQCREDSADSTESDVLQELKNASDEEEPDTDLETDRLLGHQRSDDTGYYDSDKNWLNTNKKNSLLSKLSPKIPQGALSFNGSSSSNKPPLVNNNLIRQSLHTIIPSPVPEHPTTPQTQSINLMDISESMSSPEHSDKDNSPPSPAEKIQMTTSDVSPGGASLESNADNEKKKKGKSKEVLIEGVLFRAKYLGSTQLVCEGQPTKSTRMMQAEEAVSRIKALAPEGEGQPSTEVDLFISTEKIMVLNTDLKEIMMDHALRTISYIADIGDLVVLMARRRFVPQDMDDGPKPNRTPKMICHVFESEEAQFIAQSIGQAFQVAYMEFLKANGIEDHSFVKEMDYQEVLNSQEIFGDELEVFAKKELQKEVVVPKAKGEILGVVIVESGWGSMLPTVVIANLLSNGAAARCGQLNIGDQIIAINGLSLVGLPLSTCQTYIKNTKNQTVVKFTVVPCAPVVEVKIKRPNTKYQLGFSVQNGVICSLLRGGIAERGGVRVGHRIIEINNQSVVAVPHEKIVNLLATSVGEILMKTMPTSMFRLLTGQENPIYI